MATWKAKTYCPKCSAEVEYEASDDDVVVAVEHFTPKYHRVVKVVK